jgi:hypothetical protein
MMAKMKRAMMILRLLITATREKVEGLMVYQKTWFRRRGAGQLSPTSV